MIKKNYSKNYYANSREKVKAAVKKLVAKKPLYHKNYSKRVLNMKIIKPAMP